MRSKITVLALAVGVLAAGVVDAPPAEAHSACESLIHTGPPNDSHLTDFGCNTPLDLDCGTAEVWVRASFTGFGVFDSFGRVQMWAWNVSGGGTNLYTTGSTHSGLNRDWDNRSLIVYTNWHKVRRASVDGSGFYPATYQGDPRVTMTFGCHQATKGHHWISVPN